MAYQNINVPIETDINVALNSILNGFRYNLSNWIYVTGNSAGSYVKRREQDGFLLSSNTKRFAVIVTRKSDAETHDVLPAYKVNAKSFIAGDYDHSITQTNQVKSVYVPSNLQNDNPYWLHISTVIFDFTPSETLNSIQVTNADGVLTKGLFLLELRDEDGKKLTVLPFNSYIRFISVGSGIDTTDFSYLFYNQSLSSGFFDVIRDVMTGEMLGYSTKNTTNCFTIDDSDGSPFTNIGYQNVIIPVGALDIDSDYNPNFMINFKTLSDSIFQSNLLSVRQKCIMLSENQFSIWVKQQNTTNDSVQTLSSRLNAEVTLMPVPIDGDIEITKDSGTTWSLKANNILITQTISDVYIGDNDGILSVTTPLILPQTSKSITTDRPLDDSIVNYTYNLYNLYFKHKEYCLTNVNSYDGGDIDIEFKIKEIAIPCFTECSNIKEKANYTIMLENWNSDTTHNIYIDLIS